VTPGFWALVEGEIATTKPYLLVPGLLLTATLVRLFAPGERRRVRGMVLLTSLVLVLLPVVALLELRGAPAGAAATRLAMRLFEVLAVVGMAGVTLFTAVLPLVRMPAPRILQDVIMAAAALVAGFAVAANSGFNLSGLITTSAVLTAVIGFSLQDTLGNIMGGLALQMDNSLAVGQWVKVGDVAGKVAEIRWRHTAVMTRNGEVVLIPNGVVMKSTVTLIGRGFQPGRWRRWIWFNVDFRYQPSDVIEAVESALRSAPIPNVADDPPPNCVCMDLHESYCRYAVRYWLTDPQPDDPTDSVVRTRIFFALQRARIKLSMPAHAIFMTQETEERDQEKEQEDLAKRVAALGKLEVIRSLSSEEIQVLATELRYAPFAPGEVMTRQGAEAHWLYLIVEGSVSVRITVEGAEREVARLGPGHFFGEMSLMTGRPREATVVAVTDVECYRLGAESFKRILIAHPEKAEDFAEVLANRRVALEAVRQGLSEDAQRRRTAEQKADLLDTIQAFFGLR
jgi:small-conductance mechanosensitive channel